MNTSSLEIIGLHTLQYTESYISKVCTFAPAGRSLLSS